MDKIVSLAKRRGFIYPSSEIYGGTGSVYDFGPYGVELKRNLKNLWWKKFVQEREDIVGIDSGILMRREVWLASGHEKGFVDPLVECKKCHTRFRKDEFSGQCPHCGSDDLTEAKQFNLLFKTFMGPTEGDSALTYLRPETAQGIFTNFKNIQESSRKKLPFGVAQIGKAFRNEITTGNFIFRTREFEQGEIEYFVKPTRAERSFEKWVKEWEEFYFDLGLDKKNLSLREHTKDELAHYSVRTVDLEFRFPFGKSELAGIANRTDWDLKRHSEHSGRDLKYFDEEEKKEYYPFIIEPTLGFDRAMLAILINSYFEEEIEGEKRIVLKLAAKLAPVKAAILPLVRKDKGLVKTAREIFAELKNKFAVEYDETGSIGRRYRRQDEIGTPFCLTTDGQTLKDKTVTLRNRDTLKQARVRIKDLVQEIEKRLS